MQGVLSYEFGPDDRYYLVGLITHTDLNIRNLCGFDTLDQAGAIAKRKGDDELLATPPTSVTTKKKEAPVSFADQRPTA